MSKVEFTHTAGSSAVKVLSLLIFGGTCSCAADSFSSSSNWLTCKTDDECVAAFGAGSCSSNQVCVDEDGKIIPLDLRTNSEPATAETDEDTHTSENDAASSGAESSSATTTTNVITASDASVVATSNTTAPSDTSDASSPQAVCASACAETGDLVLPLALCEDWNVHRAGKMYEFCDTSGLAGTCAERCEQVLSQASVDCAALLPSVISCVAASGFYSNGPQAMPSQGCLFPACQLQLLRMASACSELRDEWQTAKELWASAAIASYQLQYAATTIQVDGDDAMVVKGEQLNEPPTVAGLFDLIEVSLDTPERPLIATYDPMLGYPTQLQTHDLDPDTRCASVVSEIDVSNLTRD